MSASMQTHDAVSSSRRNFLKLTATAAIGGGLTLTFGPPRAARFGILSPPTRRSRRTPFCASTAPARSPS